MTTFEDMAKATKHLAAHLGTGKADHEYALRNREASVAFVAAADTDYYVHVFHAVKACTLISARFTLVSGQASSGTDYVTLELGKTIAASDTAFDTKGGASTAIAAKTAVSFTIDSATDTIAAGGQCYFKITNTGTGPAIGNAMCHVEYRLD